MSGDDPAVGSYPMVAADLTRCSLANCNTVLDVRNIPLLSNVDDASGLPLLDVNVNGKHCKMLLDTGSKLNLVSRDFLVNSLNISSDSIRSTDVHIKGVSGNIFQAAGELDLSFVVSHRNFSFTFVVLHDKTFPADLLLSYASLKCLVFPGDAFLSLVISDSSRLSNVANLVTDESVIEGEMECMGCCPGCEFCSLGRASTVVNPQTSVELNDACVDEVMVLQYMTGDDFHKFKQIDDVSVEARSNLFDVNVVEATDSCFSEVSSDSRVGLITVNEDASILAYTARDVTLVPDEFTKVCLRCDEVGNNEVLVLCDKFLHSDVALDNVLSKAVNGNFFVYAKSTNGMKVNVLSGASFCDVVNLKHRSVTLSQEAFSCTSLPVADTLQQELHVSDFVEATDGLISLLKKFRGTVALSGDALGRTNVLKHNITLQQGTTPFYVPNYRLPMGRRQAVDELISDMKKQGVVTDSKSPYNSPMLLVPKKDGTWRLVVDYRRLNSITVPDRMPMPILDEVLCNLSGSSVFSSLDLLSGYWQMPLDEESKPLTAFSTHNEHLQFEVMPFGLANAPLSFVRLMGQVLGNLPQVFCYMDDIIVFTKDVGSHLQTLELVFERLREAGLRVKLKKCRFFMKQLEFLGHTVTSNGIRTQENKIKAIVEYPPPKNIKALRRFLGIIGYYRAFVRSYASIAFPLTNLLKADCQFHWGDEEQKAFECLKEKLVQAPILTYPNFNKQFLVACDASDVGVGAVLLQKGDKRLMPISFASRVLSRAERNYSVTERELLAVVWALRKFRHTILGFPVQVITDHLPVVDLFKKRAFVQNAKFNRWFLSVLEFNPQFRYLPGRYNTIADGLSRVSEDENDGNSKQAYSFTIQNVDLDMALVRIEQEKDDEVRRLLGKLLTDESASSNYVVIDGLLYLKPTKEGGCARLFVPESLRKMVLELVHSHRLSGHPGIAKTLRHLGRNFFWPGCKDFVKNFISECSTCQLHKGITNKPAPLEIYPSQLLPFHTVSMDIMGPFPVTEEGYRYILVFMDYLSRYSEFCPIKDKSSIAVAEALRHRIITRHSCPRVLLSDNAKEFTSEIIQNLCKSYGIKKCQIVAYKPSSNGLVERANKSIISILRTVISPTTSDWHLVLDDVQMTLNNSINESVGESPHYILYGYDARMPHNLLDDAVPPRPTYNYDDYVSYRTRRSYDIVKKVRETLSKSTLSRKSRYDQDTAVPSVTLGQKVYVIKQIKEGPLYKVSPKFEGPFRVVELLKLNKFRLRHISEGYEKVSHWNHLKLIKNDVDMSFVKADTGVPTNKPDLLQVDNEDVVPTRRYDLRSARQ